MGVDRYLLSLYSLVISVLALRYDPSYEYYNLNQNQTAVDPLDYWGEWKNHTFHPSPTNWRVPFYVVTIDRYVDGDPTNNEANKTTFEHDWQSNQFRFGGDAKGLMNNLDYIQGMGIKVRLPLWSILFHHLKGSRPYISRGRPSSTCHGPVMALAR